MKPMYKTWLILGSVLALALFAALGSYQTARAVEIIKGDTIPAGETIDDDVLISGNNVVVDGTVNGDLFAFGSTVTINGMVKGSLFAVGQTIVVNGSVDGSLYAGSSSMSLGEAASIGRNLFYGGFSLTNSSGSKVGRDFLMGGYQAILSGEVGRDLRAGLGALELNGKVGRDVEVAISESGRGFTGAPPMFLPPGAPSMINPGIRVGKGAEIGGVLKYTSPNEQQNTIAVAPVGGVVYQTPQPSQAPQQPPRVSPALSLGRWILARLRDFVTLLVLGGLAVWLIPAILGRWAERVQATPLPAAGWGLVAIILGYAGAALVALMIISLGIFLGVITLGGLARSVFGIGFSSLGLVFTIFTLFVSYGSKLVVSYLAGKLILARLAPQSAEQRFLPLLVGVVVYVLLRSIPFLGWLIGLLVTLLGLGAIWLVFRDERRPAMPVTV